MGLRLRIAGELICTAFGENVGESSLLSCAYGDLALSCDRGVAVFDFVAADVDFTFDDASAVGFGCTWSTSWKYVVMRFCPRGNLGDS